MAKDNASPIEVVEFRATAPKRALPGLDDALVKLRQLKTELDLVNGLLSGTSTHSAFKQSAKEMEQFLKTNPLTKSAKRLSPAQVAQALNVPDEKDFNVFLNRWKANNKTLARTMFKGDDFASAGKAAELVRKYFIGAEREMGERISKLQALFNQGIIPKGGTTGPQTTGQRGEDGGQKSGGGAEPRPGGQRSAGPHGQTKPTKGPTTPGGGTGPPEPRTTGQPTPTKRPRTTGPGGFWAPDSSAESRPGTEPRPGEGTDKEAHAGAEPRPGAEEMRKAREFREKLAAINRDMEETIARVDERRSDPNVLAGTHRMNIAAARDQAAAHIRQAVEDAGLKEESVPVQNALAKAANLETTAENLRQTQMAADLQATGKARAALAKAQQEGDKAGARQASIELRNLEQEQKARRVMEEKRQKSQNKMMAAGGKTQAYFDKLEEAAAVAAQQEQFAQVTGMGARQAEAFLQQRGATLHSYKYNQMSGTYSGARYTYDEGGYRHSFNIDYGAEKGSAVTSTSRKMTEPEMHKTRWQNAVEGLSAQNMGANILKVAEWAAAVAVLYKAYDLAKYSLERLVTTGMESAHLGVVFRGVGGDAQALTNDIIRLAAEQGRQTSEAMESATAWARLGGDRKTINEEVRVAAMAANIANMHMAETTKQLMSLLHIYHLEAGDLNGTLSMLVNTSLKYNVTLGELFTGLDRSAAAAKVAGIGLAELQGMIATVVGKTGQSGSVVGNTIKYMLMEFNRPDVQRNLRAFGVEPLQMDKAGALQQKPGGQIISELAGKWVTMDSRSQQNLTSMLGGRFSASRIVPILEDNLQIQKLAIDGQLNLNKAQEASVKILDTLKVHLAGVRAEWDRLVMSGNVLSTVTTATAFGKNLLHDFTDVVGGPGPSAADDQRRRTMMQQAARSRPWTSPERWALIGRTWLRGWGLGGLVRNDPGLVDFYNYVHEAPQAGQSAFADRIKTLQGVAGANNQRLSFYDQAAAKLRAGKLRAEDANLVAEDIGQNRGSAKDFLNAFQGGNTSDALGMLDSARRRAAGAALAAAKEAHDATQTQIATLTAQHDSLVNTVGEKEKLGQKHDEEDKQLESLNAAIKQNTDELNGNQAALEELGDEYEQVMGAQQKFVSQLQTQSDLQERINKLYTLVPANTPMQATAQRMASLHAQIDQVLQPAFDEAIRAGYGNQGASTEQRGVFKTTQDRLFKAQAELDSLRQQNPYDEEQYQRQRGIRSAGYLSTANDYGISATDKLMRQRKALTADAAATQERLKSVGGAEPRPGHSAEAAQLTGRYLEEQNLLYQNGLSLAERRAQVEKEINQLYYDRSREFRKSVLGGGPEQLLRTLAAFRTAFTDQGGLRNISPGQLMSMGPEFRSAVTGAQAFGVSQGKVLPHGSIFMDPQMLELMQERGRLAQPGLGSFAEGGYTGDGDPNQVAGVVHKGELVIPNKDLWRSPFSQTTRPRTTDYGTFPSAQQNGRSVWPNAFPSASANSSQVWGNAFTPVARPPGGGSAVDSRPQPQPSGNDDPPATPEAWAAYDKQQRDASWNQSRTKWEGAHPGESMPTTPEGWAARGKSGRDAEWERLNQKLYGGHAPTTPEGWAAKGKSDRDTEWERLNQKLYGGNAPTTPEGWAAKGKADRDAAWQHDFGGGRWRNRPNASTTNPATGLPWDSGTHAGIGGRPQATRPQTTGPQTTGLQTTGPQDHTTTGTGTYAPVPNLGLAPGYGQSEGSRFGSGGNAQEVNGCLEMSCKLLGEFNTGLGLATAALERFTAGLSAPPRSAGGAPGVPQGGGMGGAAGYQAQ